MKTSTIIVIFVVAGIGSSIVSALPIPSTARGLLFGIVGIGIALLVRKLHDEEKRQ